ncbi:hypothetical protein HGP14_10180 [Rhizobium sp. P32RR-XVIII]|uniref:hypothetical protein n=1 Tax=Rhizobium sp. P32RR-XVIII TaxID=2726738 RepID=UPI001456F196|nr:hypothetical protein [Rhizobium sp. P32RR-XVIII]NLS03723.1 hypothetical protein [Rhizobium sp. P32RR-XVIII]
MDDNVIKFQRPKPPRKPNPALRKLLVVLTILILLGAAWGYFTFFGGQPAP